MAHTKHFSIRSAFPVTAVVLAVLIAVFFPAAVHAHAVLVDSSPKDNGVLTSPPREVVLHFNARIEKGITQVNLLASSGRKIPLPSARGGYGGSSGDRLVIPMPPLEPGTYRIQYRVLATDGHATPGLLRFTISGGRGQ